jgi:hypothetical protein
MNVKALLDVDMVALEAADKVTLMLDLTAPANLLRAPALVKLFKLYWIALALWMDNHWMLQKARC